MPVSRRLLMFGLIAAGPGGSRQAAPERGDLLWCIVEQHARHLSSPPQLHLDLAGAQRAAPDRDPQRATEQLGVDELLARPGVAVVVEHLEPELLKLLVELVGERALLAAVLAENHDLDVERGDRPGPG